MTGRVAKSTALGVIWGLLMLPILGLAVTPTSTSVQALLGLTVLVLLAALKPFARRSLVARLFLLAFSSVLILRYWSWRLLETLPSADAPLSLAAAILLFAVETYAIAIFFVTAFINADPTDRPLPPRVRAEALPTVDILVPSYNEPIDMLSVTLSAAKNIHYPAEKLRVVLCDDGGNRRNAVRMSIQPFSELPATAAASLQEPLCAELGVDMPTRAANERVPMAGNNESALDQDSTESWVAVFDPIRCPARLSPPRTVAYFRAKFASLFSCAGHPTVSFNPDPGAAQP